MTQIIHSIARNAYPGDTGRIMQGRHYDVDGQRWDSGTEYMPLHSGVDNTRTGAATTQVVTIGGRSVTFVGGQNAHPQQHINS